MVNKRRGPKKEERASSPLDERGRGVFNSVAGHVFQIGRWRGKLRNDAIDTTIMRVIGNSRLESAIVFPSLSNDR